MQIYFCVLGFFVFLMIIDKSIDLKQQVFTKNLLFYIVLTVLIFYPGLLHKTYHKMQMLNFA